MQRLRTVTLNIWNRQGPWEERLERIRAGVRELDADLIGLQEVIHHGGTSQAHAIAEGLGYHVAFGTAHDLGEGVHFGNAALSRWPIVTEKVFPLPTGASDEHRSLLMIEAASPNGNVPFFVTHLNWKFHHGVVREAQVQAIAEHVKEHAPVAGLPPIVVGDFNAEPEAAEIRFMKGLQSLGGKSTFFGDCFGQVGSGPGFTYDASTNPFAAVTHEYPRRIDYVFVRGPDKEVRGKPLSARVVFDQVEGQLAPSDHYGVLAEISF
jgi:endonuclease/exonuclease/phosphatase family metal-dependent hydrolase